MRRSLTASAIGLLVAVTVQAGPHVGSGTYMRTPPVVHQGLVELFRRRPLLHTKVMDPLVKDGKCPGELLIFHDIDTGAEAWRLTWHACFNAIHSHINRTPWNADGSKIGFLSNRGMPGVWRRAETGLGDPHPYVMEPDGSSFTLFRPRVAGFTTLYAGWWSWDRDDPTLAYWPTHKALWRTQLRPDSPSVEKVIDLPNPERRKQLRAPVGENGILLIQDINSRDYAPEVYIVDVRQDRILHQYPLSLKLDWPKHDVAKEYGFHDCTFRRNKGNTYVINYGSAGSPGEALFFELPLDGDRVGVRICYPNERDPNIPYYSHPAWADGGRLVSYFGLERFGRDEKNPGWHVRDHDARTPVVRLLDGWVGGHIAWDGYDPDWIGAATSSKRFRPEWDGWIVHAHIPDGRTRKLVRHCTKLNADRGNYASLARPAQSPDGTKVLFHSTMLQESSQLMDIYIAVSHRPAPPRKLRVSVAEGRESIALRWLPPRVGREIKGYVIHMRKPRGVGAWESVNRDPVPDTSWSHPLGETLRGGVELCVTSVEHSGLESERTSEVVEVSESGELSTTHPEGLTGFDSTPPEPPANAVVQPTPAAPRLAWTPSASPDLRYVNVYFATAAPPAPSQGSRIASVIGAAEYIDWSAPPGVEGHYALTSVDRQGNESGVVQAVPE